MSSILFAIGFLEKESMKVDFENCGEFVSPSDFDRTHARVPSSSPVLMVVHFESVKKMSRTLENLVEKMSPTCFAFFHKRLPNTFLAQIPLQLDALEKEDVEFDVGRIVN